MRQHDELEQLSALLDGELASSERVALEAHVATCADCRSTLDALRSTLADLRALPEPAPTEQDSWALRSAIRRARQPGGRWQRLAWASGAAAASVIAIVAIVAGLGGNGPRDDLAAGPEAARESLALQKSAQNYDPATAQARLLSIAGIATDAPLVAPPAPAAMQPSAEGTPLRSADVTGGAGSAYSTDAAATTEATSQELEACVGTVRASTQENLTGVLYEAATFEGRPAFLLIFHTQDRYELWVVARPSCDVLYFAEAG